MAYPYAMWPGGMPQMYAIPAIPSSSAFSINPDGAVRDAISMYTNGDLRSMCDESQKGIIKMMLGNDDQKKIILAVLKERLGQGWPYNYKALDLLELAGPADLMGLKDDLNKLAEAAPTVQGHEELKKLAKPLAGKVKEAEKKKEEEEAKKKQEAIAAMWGGLWANDPYRGPSLAAAGWAGWPYP